MNEIHTSAGKTVQRNLLQNYFQNLVNQFFKILPMRENNESTLIIYMKSLQSELLGCEGFIPEFKENALFLTLLSILQYLIDNPRCEVINVKRHVFRAISVCNKLESMYTGVSK